MQADFSEFFAQDFLNFVLAFAIKQSGNDSLVLQGNIWLDAVHFAKVCKFNFGHVFVFYDSIFKVHGFTCADAHFDVTRAAKFPACDGNGKAKQCHKGKAKE
jgi:hypothetical protein